MITSNGETPTLFSSAPGVETLLHAENAKEHFDARVKALQKLKQEQTFGDSRND